MLTKNTCIFLLAVFVMASCAKEESFKTDTLIIDKLGSETLTSAQSTSNSVEISEKPDGVSIVVPGASSKLHRTANGITVNFKTNGLIPGNAYTMWFVIFGDAPGPPFSTHAAGHIASGSGKGNFSGHISVGDDFDNPQSAAVHMVLRSHGPAQPGIIPSQIQTIDGGCTSGYPSGPGLHPDSDVVGYCANIQVAIHPGN